jgi:hypothetical protein
MDGAQVGVLEQSDEVRFSCLLEGEHSRALESEVCLVVLSDLTNEPLEWKLSDEEFGRLLVFTDLTESDCPWPITVGLLHAAGGGRRFLCGLGGEMFLGLLSSWGFACSMLCASHLNIIQTRRSGFYIPICILIYAQSRI